MNIRCALFLLTFAITAPTAELKPQEVKAWEEYIQTARARVQTQLRPGSHFLKIDEDQAWVASVRSGEVLVLPGEAQSLKKIPFGVIHDWLGAAFLPNARLSEVLSLVRHYERYKEFYAPTVIDSIALTSSGFEDRFSMVLSSVPTFIQTKTVDCAIQ